MEQVTRTVASLRTHGWTNITMLEIQHRRLEVRRQQPRGYADGASARTLSEALSRLVTVNNLRDARRDDQLASARGQESEHKLSQLLQENSSTYHARPGGKKEKQNPDEGRLITRNEAELKTHTSYLTFATLPRSWTEEDEEAAAKEVERVSSGVNKGTVGDKEKRWKKEKVEGEPESNRSKKRKAREERLKRAEEKKAQDEDSAETRTEASVEQQNGTEGMEIDG